MNQIKHYVLLIWFFVGLAIGMFGMQVLNERECYRFGMTTFRNKQATCKLWAEPVEEIVEEADDQQ